MVNDSDIYVPWVRKYWDELDVARTHPDELRAIILKLDTFLSDPNPPQIAGYSAVNQLARLMTALGEAVQRDWEQRHSGATEPGWADRGDGATP